MAEELSGQALQLSETIAFFKLGEGAANAAEARKNKGHSSSAAAPGPSPTVTAKSKAATLPQSPKAHARTGIVINLDDEGAGPSTDADDANFKEF